MRGDLSATRRGFPGGRCKGWQVSSSVVVGVKATWGPFWSCPRVVLVLRLLLDRACAREPRARGRAQAKIGWQAVEGALLDISFHGHIYTHFIVRKNQSLIDESLGTTIR